MSASRSAWVSGSVGKGMLGGRGVIAGVGVGLGVGMAVGVGSGVGVAGAESRDSRGL